MKKITATLDIEVPEGRDWIASDNDVRSELAQYINLYRTRR